MERSAAGTLRPYDGEAVQSTYPREERDAHQNSTKLHELLLLLVVALAALFSRRFKKTVRRPITLRLH